MTALSEDATIQSDLVKKAECPRQGLASSQRQEIARFIVSILWGNRWGVPGLSQKKMNKQIKVLSAF
jgi:hypothetical protein